MFQASPSQRPESVDFLLLPRFSMAAFTSAVEPLRAANLLSERSLYDWRTYSLDGEPVAASNGIVVVPAGSLQDLGQSETVFVCAGLGMERFGDKVLHKRLRELARQGRALGGLCTGPLALARAGLLDGYRCTIHWEHVEGFVEEFPELDITATLFEIDQKRYTCSGGMAALDMMINAVARRHGDDLAVRVAEFLLHHSVRHPHETQRMTLEHRTGITHPKLLAAIAHMEAYVESPVAVSEIAASVKLSSRQLERLFQDRLGKTPSRYYLELRLQRARLLLGQTAMSVMQVAVACGFTSASHFSRCYRSYFNKAPTAERRSPERVPQAKMESAA